MKIRIGLGSIGGLMLGVLLAGCAITPEPLQASSFMPAGGEVTPPYGFIGFCLRNVTDCEGGTDVLSTPELTAARWQELNAVNDHVNRLPEIEDRANYSVGEYWTYPNAHGGDCEDLALEKRRELIASGWPADALLIATGRRADGSMHAVLVAVTDHGDLVLDNLNWAILSWNEAPYVWKERQSRERPFMWVSLDGKAPAAAQLKMPPLGALPPFFNYARGAVHDRNS